MKVMFWYKFCGLKISSKMYLKLSSHDLGGFPPQKQGQDMGTTAKIPWKRMIGLRVFLKQNLAKNSAILSVAVVSLHCSRLSHIYLTTWLDSILINKCTSSTWDNLIMMSSTFRQDFSFQVWYFLPSLLYYLATLFIPLPMEYDMAVRGKQQLVKVVEDFGEEGVQCALKSYSLQTVGMKHQAGWIMKLRRSLIIMMYLFQRIYSRYHWPGPWRGIGLWALRW